MKNLLKYELKQEFLPYLIMGVIYAVSLIVIAIFASGFKVEYISKTTSSFEDVIVGLFTLLLIFSVIGFLVVWILNIIHVFGKNLFGAYGYLLFSLPLGVDKILLAKVLGCFVLMGASIVFVSGLSICIFGIVSDFKIFGVLGEFLMRLVRVDFGVGIAFVAVNLSYSLCGILEFLLHILLTLAVLNYMRVVSFKLALGILIFVGISIATGIVAAICNVFLNQVGLLPEAFVTERILGFFSDSWNMQYGDDVFASLMQNSLRLSFVFYNILSYLLPSLIYYLLARFLIIKKLELE